MLWPWLGRKGLIHREEHCTPVYVGHRSQRLADAQHYRLDASRAEEPRVSKGPEPSASLVEASQSVQVEQSVVPNSIT